MMKSLIGWNNRLKSLNRFYRVFCITLFIFIAGYIIFTGRTAKASGTHPVFIEYSAQDSTGMFFAGEELTYNVSYAFFDLGEIKIKTLEVNTVEGKTTVKAIANIDSYSGVPFVDLHAIFQSEFSDVPQPKTFVGKTKENDQWQETKYLFDYDQKKVFVEKGWENKPPDKLDTLIIKGDAQDGLSLFFFARKNSGQNKQSLISPYVGEKRSRAYIKFSDEITTTSIDAVKYDVKVNEFEGEADFTGIFGLTGGFSGQFSADDAHVPIVAKMKVLIGKVRIELKSWKRNGWQPPKA